MRLASARAVASKRERAVSGAADEHRAYGIAIHIAVVAEHAGSGDGERLVFSKSIAARGTSANDEAAAIGQ